jgi:microcompartment protein CcmL/EutN
MDKSIGLVEFQTVSSGITAADAMAKAADIDIIEAQTVCPGKYIVLFSGKLSAVKAAIEVGTQKFSHALIDSFVLGNPEDTIFKALSGTTEIEGVEALGIIETFSVASIIVAADTAAKTAKIKLVEIRIAKGMCGKCYVLLTGELAAVEASLEAASKKAGEDGMLIEKSLIPNPDKKIWEKLI